MERTILHVRIELAMFNAATRRAVEHASTCASSLILVAELAKDSIADLFFDAEPDELRARATRLRSAVLHASNLGAELQAVAGSLEQLALLRELAEPETDED
jgi:hypothetical protein